jgi:DNA-binding XRE family transcriptional regulator
MNERDEKLPSMSPAGEPANADWQRARFDPNYSASYKPDYPWSRTPNQGRSRPIAQAGDFAWIQELRLEQAVQFKAELRRRLQLMPSGKRICTLRAALGWTQRRAAEHLSVSTRSVIRHEKGHHRSLSLRYALQWRLRELESTYADQIVAYLDRGGPAHT